MSGYVDFNDSFGRKQPFSWENWQAFRYVKQVKIFYWNGDWWCGLQSTYYLRLRDREVVRGDVGFLNIIASGTVKVKTWI